jgi:NADH-quinone oxidoreductase subunit J
VPPLDTAFFGLFAALTLGGGLAVLLARNPVRATVGLMASLLGAAGLFLLQQAEFIFAVQLVLYAGGVMLLFLFVTMLVHLDRENSGARFTGAWPAALALILASFAGLGVLAALAARTLPTVRPLVQDNIDRVSQLLTTGHYLAFELASILLLSALVGAVYLARRGDA